MKKIKLFIVSILIILNSATLIADDFNDWKVKFKNRAIKEGVSKATVDKLIDRSKFLSDVIKYDRYQPEFYEDTKTYISKRTSSKKVKLGKIILNKENNIINKVSSEYKVDKNLLLALMGIETNFGNYLGKMDIVSSLATLSYDQRRSEFFTKELITLLKLVDAKIIDPSTLFGSWAGAFGNFQFMPSTIKNHAIDYNKDGSIDLKNIEDSFASAANYLSNLGWNDNTPCFYRINLNENIPDKYLNTSAKKIKNERKVKYLKNYIKNSSFLDKYDNLIAAIVTPDAEIVENANKLKPAYIIFNNYKLILKWNRSLRFSLAVCTLKNSFENET
ncbi:lytic murein transglycosylase [Candidatus Pelagibacter sp.]|nr:lytic murein transglycosylase [Candidatus Pelagibacter sp.]